MKAIRKIVAVALSTVLLIPMLPIVQAKALTYSDFKVGVPNNLSRTVDVEGKLVIDKAGFYVLETDNQDTSSWCDTIMYLMDENHNDIGMNDDNSSLENEKFSKIQRYLEKGTYYVRIKGKNYTEVACSLRVDPLENTETIQLNSNKKVNYEKEGKYIYHKEYKFTLDKETDVVLETSAIDSLKKDTTLTLYDNEHNIIERNEDIDASKGNYYSRIERKLPAGTYYVKHEAHKFGNIAAVANLSLSEKNKPYAYITSPNSKGYILTGEKRRFQVNASKATSMDLDYVVSGNSYNLADKMVWDDSLNSYIADVDMTRSMNKSCSSVNGELQWPKFRVNMVSDKGNISSEIDGYIAYYGRDNYSYMDKSWYYNDENDNSFVGLGTDEYNCMAYALGITDESIWPWSPQASGIDYDVVCFYFSKQHGYSNRSGYKYTEFSQQKMPYAQAIYYEGHVALVTAYDENGMPTEIVSKWGGLELIKSKLDGLVAWGEPLIYMKGRVVE